MTALADPPETLDALDPNSPPSSEANSGEDGWRTNRRGQQYVTARGRSGTVMRQGNETVEEAHARDAQGPTQRGPRPKPKTPPKAAAVRQVSLQEIERALADLLRAPGMLAGMQGDEWAADHFVAVGPIVARNLCKAAETNPWLRSKLEAAVLGSDLFLMRVLGLVPVCTAIAAYTVPAVIYYADPGFIPPAARAMYAVPKRPPREIRMRAFGGEESDAESAPGAAAAASAAAGPGTDPAA